MNQLLFYLLQVVIASGLLYCYYHFALRNKKFHRYNRFYLLIAVLISTIVPFLNIPVYFTPNKADSSVILQTLQIISSPLASTDETISSSPQTIASSAAQISLKDILFICYFLVCLIFLQRILFSLNRIRLLIKNHTIDLFDRIKFVNTDEPGTPFSFFRWLFWNRKLEMQSEKGEQIFRHELFHIQQKHSRDIIFIELLTMIFWINPFFHLVKREIKAIHEFLADEFAVKEKNNWQYAELLLMQMLNTNNQLVNPFFHNQIKRRIAMITTSKKPSYQYLRKIMVLPLAALIISLFAFNYKDQERDALNFEKAINPITVVIDAGHGGTDKGAVTRDGKYSEAQIALEISKKIQLLADEYNINVVMTRESNEFPGGVNNKQDALRQRVQIVKDVGPDAFITIHLNSHNPSAGATEKSGIEAYITNQRFNTIDINLASIVLGELKSVYKTVQEIRKREDQGIFVLDKANSPSLLLECGFINNPADLSFILDEKNQEKIARAILKGLVRFTNNSNVAKVDRQELITSRDTTKKRIYKAIDLRKALIVIDGVIQEKRGIESLDSNLFFSGKIAVAHLYKNKAAIKKYGEEGKDGVVEITTRPDSEKSSIIIMDDSLKPKPDTLVWIKDYTPPARKSPTSLQLKDWSDAKMYGVWLDGKRIVNSDLTKYQPSDFGLYYVSKLSKNAVNYGKHYVQVDLYSNQYYDSKIKNKISGIVMAKGYVDSNATQDDDKKVFVKVEEEPSFPGGEKAWRKFLTSNLNATLPVTKGAKPGTYTVIIQFIVDKEGNISDARALTNHGFGMEEECLRVLKLSPKWKPAIQKGQVVKAYKKQPITFVLDAGKKSTSSNANLDSDITMRNFEDPSTWNYRDTAFLNWRKMKISEIKAIARSEGKAAYYYAGRTYVFASIDESRPTTDQFYETDGLQKGFVLNGELIHSIDEINSCYERKDIKSISFVSAKEAKTRYNINRGLASIETYDSRNSSYQ